MSKHSYGFPAGTDKKQAVASALEQAVAEGFITSADAATTEIVESEAHRSDEPELVMDRHGNEQLMPHTPEFVVVVRPLGTAGLS